MSPDRAIEFRPDDDLVHPHDPDVWSWNESFLLSWLTPGGGPSGLFRLGLLPNQGRGWLWFFLHLDGEWLTVEETRLDLRHFDLANGATHDAWGLRFGWTPIEPLQRGVFQLDGVARVRSGPRSGALVPLSLELTATATAPCFGTGTGHEPDERPQFPASRFEQSVMITGTADGRREDARHRVPRPPRPLVGPAHLAGGVRARRPARRGSPALVRRCSPAGRTRFGVPARRRRHAPDHRHRRHGRVRRRAPHDRTEPPRVRGRRRDAHRR